MRDIKTETVKLV